MKCMVKLLKFVNVTYFSMLAACPLCFMCYDLLEMCPVSVHLSHSFYKSFIIF